MGLRDERRNGLDGIVLESDEVSLSVFPAAGGKIMDLIHRPSGRNLLWHNPRIDLAATNPGASFDDVWCGGWDEIFPTDPPCADALNSYHDHGDLWIGPWSATPDGDHALVLERASASLPCVMTKRLEVVGDTLRGFLNGQLVVEASDSTFRAGRVGLWTKADSVTCFDDVVLTPGTR